MFLWLIQPKRLVIMLRLYYYSFSDESSSTATVPDPEWNVELLPPAVTHSSLFACLRQAGVSGYMSTGEAGNTMPCHRQVRAPGTVLGLVSVATTTSVSVGTKATFNTLTELFSLSDLQFLWGGFLSLSQEIKHDTQFLGSSFFCNVWRLDLE